MFKRALQDAWYSLYGFIVGEKHGYFQWNGIHYMVVKPNRWTGMADCYAFDEYGKELEDEARLRPPAEMILESLGIDPRNDEYNGVHWEQERNMNE